MNDKQKIIKAIAVTLLGLKNDIVELDLTLEQINAKKEAIKLFELFLTNLDLGDNQVYAKTAQKSYGNLVRIVTPQE